MTPREIALSICEPWFNGDPCDGCKCHKVCTKLVDRIAAAIQAVDSTVADHIVGANKKADHIPDATKMMASVREDRTVEPVGYGVFEDGNLHDSFRLEHEAKLFAAFKGEHAEVHALYTAPAKREPVATLNEKETVEPVAYVTGYRDGWCVISPVEHVVLPTGMALYLSPPTRTPLTDEEIQSLADEFLDWNLAGIESFARAVERAHGIGGEE